MDESQACQPVDESSHWEWHTAQYLAYHWACFPVDEGLGAKNQCLLVDVRAAESVQQTVTMDLFPESKGRARWPVQLLDSGLLEEDLLALQLYHSLQQ